MSNIGMSGAGGADPRYLQNLSTPTSHTHNQPDRRRRGKNINGYYNNNGPRDGRMNNYRGDGRMSHRGSGGGGDGPHNGSGYRGGGVADYDSQLHHQSNMASCPPNAENHVRSAHTNYHHYQHQHHHSHHHGHQSKGLDYEGMVSTSRQPRGHQTEHRSGGSQSTDNCNINQHPHAGHGGGGNLHHTMVNSNEIIVVPAQQQEHGFPTSGHAHVANHFQGAPQQIPATPAPPTVGFFGFHPNSQPMLASLALCHIPYGVNPSSVISPAVYTQIIGSGILTPGLPYNYQYGFPSPVVPSHPVLIQSAHPQHVQHHYHAAGQQHFPGQPMGGMQHPPQQTNNEECGGVGFTDSSSLLNPDAEAFFHPGFPLDDDIEGDHLVCNKRDLETSDIKSDEHDTHAGDVDDEEEGEQTTKKDDNPSSMNDDD